MRTLFSHISGIASLLVLIKELWNDAPLERIIFAAAVVGLTVYTALLLADVSIRRILDHTPPALAEEAAGAAGGAGNAAHGTDERPGAPE